MRDPAFEPLFSHLRDASHCLWLADESHADVLERLARHPARITLLSNRYDIACKGSTLGLDAHFADWQIEAPSRFDLVALRICKEKSVNFHLINSAFDWLCPGGRLLISGGKNEGIKSAAAGGTELFASASKLQKLGAIYFQFLEKSASRPNQWLETQNYQEIQPIGSWQGLTLYSKPGVYGWNKIDRGSELLIEHCRRWLQAQGEPRSSLLDIGCGYGLLTVAFADLPFERRVATDNNAAALNCTDFNATARQMKVEVIPGDCADQVSGLFDTVVCNPPFHAGFDVVGSLTERFLHAARQKLAPGGAAFFVVNRFIAIEKKAAPMFSYVECLTEADGFKVVVLRP